MLEGAWFLLLVRDYINFVRDVGLTARLSQGKGLVVEYCDGEAYQTFYFRVDGCLQTMRDRVMAELKPVWEALKLSDGVVLQRPPEGLDEAELTLFDPNWRWLFEE